jgi:hypothetical protein
MIKYGPGGITGTSVGDERATSIAAGGPLLADGAAPETRLTAARPEHGDRDGSGLI